MGFLRTEVDWVLGSEGLEGEGGVLVEKCD